MNEFLMIILVSLFATNLLDKSESVQFEETPLKIIDEIFGEGWWDNEKDEEWNKLTLEHSLHHQIDQQNTQIGQIEPNSTDQNPFLTESDHSNNVKNGEEISSNEKRKIVDKFQVIRNELKQKEKYSKKERTKIEQKIAKHLKVSRKKIYEWKKEFGLSRKRKMHNIEEKKEEHKHLVEKFDQRKAELKRDGLKNSYKEEIDKTVAKELGICVATIYSWKSELGQTTPQHKHSHSEQKELMKRYYEIKDKNSKIRDVDIAKLEKPLCIVRKSNSNDSNSFQILSLDILWKRMPVQISGNRKLEFGE